MKSNDEPEAIPERIVEPDGRVHVGWYPGPVPEQNLSDAPVRHLLSSLRGTPLGALERSYKRLRLKSWQYVSVASPRSFFACAVVDAGYVANAFVYAVDRATGRVLERTALAPLAMGASIAKSSVQGMTTFDKRGFGRIVIENDVAAGTRRVRVTLPTSRGVTLEARYVIHDRGSDPTPVVVVEQSEPGRWLYTHKCYGLAAEGDLKFGEVRDEVARHEGHAGLDYNYGYRPRETWWNWAAAGGYAVDGARIGFNLTAHRRWDREAHGDEPDAGDCALWIAGRCVKLARVTFDYDRGDLMLPWRIRDADGLVDLRFEPLGERSEAVELGVVASRFRQPYGRFVGELCDREGRRVTLGDVFGVTEQHYARW